MHENGHLMKKQQQSSYNQVVCNPFFHDSLQAFSIQLIAPGSGTSAAVIEQLKEIPKLNLDFSHLKINQDLPFHACDDNERLKQLKNVLYNDSDEIIIWTIRGGYGSARLIDKLYQLPPPVTEKIFIGFSDNTALHLFFSKHWKWKTIHGSGFAQLLDTKQDPQNFLKITEIILGKTKTHNLSHLTPMNQNAIHSKSLSGQLTGGNLTLVENSIGTLWQIETENKILFLEEIGEKGYRIDRSLLHLHQAGLLNNVCAIIFGEFLCDLKENHITLALQRFAEHTDIPVFQTHQFGHGHTNYPLIYNANAEVVPEGNHIFSLRMNAD